MTRPTSVEAGQVEHEEPVEQRHRQPNGDLWDNAWLHPGWNPERKPWHRCSSPLRFTRDPLTLSFLCRITISSSQRFPHLLQPCNPRINSIHGSSCTLHTSQDSSALVTGSPINPAFPLLPFRLSSGLVTMYGRDRPSRDSRFFLPPTDDIEFGSDDDDTSMLHGRPSKAWRPKARKQRGDSVTTWVTEHARFVCFALVALIVLLLIILYAHQSQPVATVTPTSPSSSSTDAISTPEPTAPLPEVSDQPAVSPSPPPEPVQQLPPPAEEQPALTAADILRMELAAQAAKPPLTDEEKAALARAEREEDQKRQAILAAEAARQEAKQQRAQPQQEDQQPAAP